MNRIIGSVSIIFGGMIYVLFRKQSLLMFSWFNSIGLASTIVLLRDSAKAYMPVIPEWLCFSLPNALWALGGVLLFSSIWQDCLVERILWALFFSVIAVGCEIGQLIGIIPGTYDSNDLKLILIFILISILISNSQVIKEVRNAKDL